jgi:hypothetical protein
MAYELQAAKIQQRIRNEEIQIQVNVYFVGILFITLEHLGCREEEAD